MSQFTANMSGWQKLILAFGAFGAAILALRFVPTETGTLLTWVTDLVRAIFTGGTP